MQTLAVERKFETFSYLPPLNDQQIARQLQYALSNGYSPAIEFSFTGKAEDLVWTLWKLPLFGAQSPEEVLSEIQACKQQFPNAYIRVVAFDSIRQVQTLMFLVYKPL